MSIGSVDDLAFDAVTPWVKLFTILGLSYIESSDQVPTISSLSDFCWPSASLGGRAIPRHRNAKAVNVSVVCRFIVFISLWFHSSVFVCRLLTCFGISMSRRGHRERLWSKVLSDTSKWIPRHNRCR